MHFSFCRSVTEQVNVEDEFVSELSILSHWSICVNAVLKTNLSIEFNIRQSKSFSFGFLLSTCWMYSLVIKDTFKEERFFNVSLMVDFPGWIRILWLFSVIQVTSPSLRPQFIFLFQLQLTAQLRRRTSTFPRLIMWHFYYQLAHLQRAMELLCGFLALHWGHVLSRFSISFNQSGGRSVKAVGFNLVPIPWTLFEAALLCTI